MFSFKKLPLILMAVVAAFTLPSTRADTICDLLDGDDPDLDDYTDILALLEENSLCAELEEGTLFAPNNAALGALNETLAEAGEECEAAVAELIVGILKYHVVSPQLIEADDIDDALDIFDVLSSKTLDDDKLIEFTKDGGSIFINEDTEIIKPDLASDDDAIIVHGIDNVLTPPDFELPSSCSPTFCGYLDTTAEGDFTVLLGALNSTGLCDDLDELDKGTLFAPTDKAFDDLPDNILECLVNKTDALTDILLYHVAKNELTSEALTEIGGLDDPSVALETLLKGEKLSVNSTSGAILINDNSEVQEPFDVDIVNGILHTIDNVLVPPDTDFDKICNGTSTSSKSAKSSSKSKAGKRDKMAAAMALPGRGGGRISRNSREEEDEEIASLNEEEGLSMLFGRRTLKGEKFLD